MDKMKNETTSSTETVTISRAEYEAKERRIAELEQQVAALMEAVRLARHKRFGASSEQTDEGVMEQLSFLFNEAEIFATEAAEDSEEEPVVVSEHKRHKKHESTLNHVPEDIPVEVVEHRLEGEALECPNCGETMTEIGTEVKRELKIRPAEFVVVEHRYYSYACQKCNQEDIETPVVKAPREESVIPGGFATPEAIAYIMTQKFTIGSPLYRLEQEMRYRGMPLSRQTMSNWILRASADYLTPVYEQLHRELLDRSVLHADETVLQVLHEPGKKPQTDSYMWLYRTGGDTERPIVLYEYQPSRSGKNPREFLEGFQGYLHTDGYAGYHNLPPGITVVGCWAHARRKFDEAVKAQPKGKQKNSSAAQGLAWCNMLFKIEEGLAELSPEELL